jgi:glycosyltransferase involved in cell wall biosynthesis
MRVMVERRTPAAGGADMSRVAVVLPAYNEAAHIGTVVGDLLAVGVGRIVCVDDCSTDETGGIVDRLAMDERVEAVHHRVNRGKQAAVKHGVQAAVARGAFAAVALLDADTQHDPSLLPGLCGHIGTCDIVATRRSTEQMPAIRQVANRLANTPYRIIGAAPFSDIQSGYRVYTCELAVHLAAHLPEEGRYVLEHSSVVLAAQFCAARARDLRVVEVDVPCTYSGVQSSIRPRDNLQLTWAAILHAAALARLRMRGTSR